MPWHTAKGGGTCAAGEWAVIKDSDGSTAGCHPTEAAAKKQLAALYAKEPQMNEQGPRGGEYRSFRFDLERADAEGDDLTFEGYAAVFGQPTRIKDWEGEFDETVKRGAFKRTLETRTPKLMFEHGQHPLVGQMPLGVISEAREDRTGLFIRARLSDNWLIQPVRDAIRDGAVDGMSFRFSVPEGGDTWKYPKDGVPLRTLQDIDVPEVGPVVFPAYEPTTASIRSLVERLDTIKTLTDGHLSTEQAIGIVEGFTGRGDARSAPGGDPDPEPRDGDGPTLDPWDDPERRDLALRVARSLRP